MQKLLPPPPRCFYLKPGIINLAVLILAALGASCPVRAQGPTSKVAIAPTTKGELPAPAVVNPPGTPGSVSMGSTGLNLICAGDHLTLSATGGNGTYT